MKNKSLLNNVSPLEEGLWTFYKGSLLLMGHRCASCSEVFFPRRKHGHCPHCFHKALEEIYIGPKGILTSFSVVMIAPAGGFYLGPVPFGYGCVDFPERVKIKGLLSQNYLELYEVGMEVSLSTEVLYVSDNGTPVETFVLEPSKYDRKEKR